MRKKDIFGKSLNWPVFFDNAYSLGSVEKYWQLPLGDVSKETSTCLLWSSDEYKTKRLSGT